CSAQAGRIARARLPRASSRSPSRRGSTGTRTMRAVPFRPPPRGPEGARAPFLPHAGDAGAPGDLARARLVALAQPDEDLARLLRADTADGLVVLTDALLARRPCAAA